MYDDDDDDAGLRMPCHVAWKRRASATFRGILANLGRCLLHRCRRCGSLCAACLASEAVLAGAFDPW